MLLKKVYNLEYTPEDIDEYYDDLVVNGKIAF